ncbi:aminotransferase-like domain-containing protein [Trinickia acidisoli]|uniref:aminotransferase-like domain-containing protein n=1 Tax=Trinickia acidisoli TaxID=2767482 RepID=UPI001A8CEE38|nr:PLP-dependent aminotransferase family protein [Trinickia acidisoli]
MNHPPSHRYEQLAELIAQMIEKGTLAAGARLPSLRAASEQHGVSLSTTLQAYRLLEQRGVLTARSQSGYYVNGVRTTALALPSMSRGRTKPSTVSISDAVTHLLEHAANTSLVPLGCAVPDAALLQAARLDRTLARLARTQGENANIYSAPLGEHALRQAIAQRAMRVGQALSADDILITCGCTEALVLALSAVASRGQAVAIESPTYFGLLHTLEALGLKAFELPTDPIAGVDVAALARLLETETISACVLSSSFNNPLGSTMPDANKRSLLALLTAHDIPLIEDDIYGDLHFGRERPKPFIALDGGANTIYCSSFSKSIAPGYRVGWITAGVHMARVVERKLAFSLCSAVLPQRALADFLATGAYDTHLRRVRRVFQENLARMARTVEASFPAGTKVSRPQGGFVLWLELPRSVDTRTLFDKALERGICFAPGDVFSASRRFRNCLRLSAGYSWTARIESGVRTLGSLAREALMR